MTYNPNVANELKWQATVAGWNADALSSSRDSMYTSTPEYREWQLYEASKPRPYQNYQNNYYDANTSSLSGFSILQLWEAFNTAINNEPEVIYGTSKADTIDSRNSSKTNITIYGYAGDDKITAGIKNREGIDVVYAGEGSDMIWATSSETNSAQINVFGEEGSDVIIITSDIGNTHPEFETVGDQGIQFKKLTSSIDGSPLKVLIGYDVETIIFDTNSGDLKIYLMEDIRKGIVKTVSWDEMVIRNSTYETNRQPSQINLSTNSFKENINANSTVGILSAIDPDTSDTHTYKLVDGYTASVDNNNFSISGNNLIIKSSPDYETKNTYSIAIQATDDKYNTSEVFSFTLKVEDINEDINKPTQTSATENTNTNSSSSIKYLSIDENLKSIETFTSSGNVTWSISGGEQDLFSINSSTGELEFKNPPDYEKPFEPEGTIIKFQTNYSTSTVAKDFYIELYDKQSSTNTTTPITVNNFINYINDGSYDKTLIHRLVSDFVIQGGGYTWPTKASNEIGGYPLKVTSKSEIMNEPGNSNLMGTLAMAKLSGQPNSATSEWFINLSDNEFLDSQNEGFTVFGHILGDGIENPLLLNDQSSYNVNYTDNDLNLPELPLVDVQENVIRETNYFAIHSINTVNERPNEIANKYNVIVTSTNSAGAESNQYIIVEVKDVIETENSSSTDNSASNLNNISLTINSDIINKITRTISNTTQTYFGASSNYKFYNLGEDRYALQTDSGYDEITGVTNLQFSDKTLNLENDIADTFDQVTGLNTNSGEMFRLYNAAFARFPDADGLKYWIDQFSSGRNTRRVVAQSFLGSAEFTEKYGSNVSDETYVNNLYKNVLGRDADAEGLNYWVGNLSSGLETRYEALLGFAESAENKALFTDMTGFG